jgi:cobalamin biosynthesis protein CbiG
VLGAILSLVVGIGLATAAGTAEVAALVGDAVRDATRAAGPDSPEVIAVATISSKAGAPAVVALGWPVVAFSADELAAVDVPHPSARADAAAGTPSVAEAAALLAAGPGAELVVAKRTSARATVAVARRRLG